MITIPITLRMLIAKYLCLLKPFWLRKNNKTSVLLIIIILAMILGVVKIQVWLNDWNNDFFNALSQKETDKLWQLVLWFPALLGIDLERLYRQWRGKAPKIMPMLQHRGLNI